MTYRIISEKLLYRDALEGGRFPTSKPVQNAFETKIIFHLLKIFGGAGGGPHGHDATGHTSVNKVKVKKISRTHADRSHIFFLCTALFVLYIVIFCLVYIVILPCDGE